MPTSTGLDADASKGETTPGYFDLMVYMWDNTDSTDHTVPALYERERKLWRPLYRVCVSDVCGTVAPSSAMYGVIPAQWGHVDLQVDATGSFVLNKNIFTALFLTPAIAIE